ncbi:MAG: hypothetical protein JW871_01670 [Endomicrobiales bacterium]|nr:hypothetical protein [Endomicrobiales bacterium]
MKKLMLVAALCLCCQYGFAQEPIKGKSMSLGLDFPLVGWTSTNENGEIKKIIGINGGVGVSVKSYFEPPKYGKFNTYLSYGTVLLVVPYVGVGGDYVFNSGFYIGAGLIWIAPEVHLGFMF